MVQNFEAALPFLIENMVPLINFVAILLLIAGMQLIRADLKARLHRFERIEHDLEILKNHKIQRLEQELESLTKHKVVQIEEDLHALQTKIEDGGG